MWKTNSDTSINHGERNAVTECLSKDTSERPFDWNVGSFAILVAKGIDP